jgi:4-amino-4-deoxy-L-arabinose transferase-like glycosyltransferase
MATQPVKLSSSWIEHLDVRLSISLRIFIFALAAYLVLALVQPREWWGTVPENSYVAASLASGHGFSSPYLGFPYWVTTGPSALVPPSSPFVLAGIFKIFGVLSNASHHVAVGLNIVVHAISCVLLYWICVEIFGSRKALFAAMGLALVPLLTEPLTRLDLPGERLFIPPKLVWNTHLTELAVLLLIWVTLRLANWAVSGIVWGASALTNPTVLALVPAFWGWRMREKRRWLDLVLTASALALCLAPWLIRNYLVFHRPVFLRDGFGIELRVGNQPGGRGLWTAAAHPSRSEYELRRFTGMGELKYAEVSENEALAVIRARPLEFAVNTARRVVYFWLGPPPTPTRLRWLRFLKYLPALVFCLLTLYGAISALRNGNRKAQLLIAVLVFFPLVHYITHTSNALCYQYPIQPEMIALAVSPFVNLKSKGGN